jgi:hypothetical protein
LAATLFRLEGVSGAKAFLILGTIVTATAFCTLLLRFSEGNLPATEVQATPAFMPAD